MNFGYLQQVGSGLPGLAKTISRNPQIIPLVKVRSGGLKLREQ